MGIIKKLFNTNSKITVISPQEAKKMMSQSDNYILLDVRTRAEYDQARIEGAKSIPLDELNLRAPVELPDKNIPVFVYCHSGARAAKAADLLAGMGYTNILNFGGIISWPYEKVK